MHEKLDQSHSKVQEEIDKEFQEMVVFLQEQFGDVVANEKEHEATVNVDGATATVDCIKFVSFVIKVVFAPTMS